MAFLEKGHPKILKLSILGTQFPYPDPEPFSLVVIIMSDLTKALLGVEPDYIICPKYTSSLYAASRTKTLSWLGVGLVFSGSLVQFPAGALWFVLGQDSLFHIASVYPAAKWEPSMHKAVLRVCALYAASCSGISPGGLKWFPCAQCLLGEEGCVSTSVDTRL